MNVLDDLKRDEGFRAVAYPDPLTGAEPWTVGYGCTGPDITSRTVWTVEHAEEELAKRVQQLTTQLHQVLPWFTKLAEPRQAVLVNMAYQIGLHGLLGFHDTLAAISTAKWGEAAAHMLASHWAAQTPERAKRLSRQMLTGARS